MQATGNFRTTSRGTPEVIDGRTTNQSYMIIAALAAAASWNAVVAMDAKHNGNAHSIKMKFYPTADFFLNEDMMREQFGAHDWRNRYPGDRDFPGAGYQRFYLTKENLVKFMEWMWDQPQFVVAPVKLAFEKLGYTLPGNQTFDFDSKGRRFSLVAEDDPRQHAHYKKLARALNKNPKPTLPPTATEKQGRHFKTAGEMAS
jgi:hypothetical protein